MYSSFFLYLRAQGLPVTIPEYLSWLEALSQGIGWFDIDQFYYLARMSLVKDERHIDSFDRAFAQHFKGIIEAIEVAEQDIPQEWLDALSHLDLTDAEKEKIKSLGGWEKLMETLQQRLQEQKKRHAGGSKWIGTAGRSPFGAYGYNPEGVRIGQHKSRHRRAVKVWDKRTFRNFSDDVQLGTRNLKVALRKLRQFARTGAATELDLEGTIRATADHAGMLDVKLIPERHNAVKVVLLMDVGGSMDDHIQQVEELFSAARSEFKHLEYYYFHNCPYEFVWRDNARRYTERIPTYDMLHTYGTDYKLIFVGDASMSPYELVYPGGSVEHWNAESGQAWLLRLQQHFSASVWLNPVPEKFWAYTQSIAMVQDLMPDRMFPLTLAGLAQAVAALQKKQ
jgi:uncharacterized protein with von Willebrand factor type A (vWA) domain